MDKPLNRKLDRIINEQKKLKKTQYNIICYISALFNALRKRAE